MRTALEKPIQGAVYQVGARSHFAVPVCLERNGLLHSCTVDFAVSSEILARFPRRLGALSERLLKSRVVRGVPTAKLHASIFLASAYIYRLRAASTIDEKFHLWLQYAQKFGEHWATQLKRTQPDFTYTFSHAGQEVLETARSLGVVTFHEQFSLPKRLEAELTEVESECFPAWKTTTMPANRDLLTALTDREEAELRTTDWILTPSTTVKDALTRIGVHPKKILLLPYGVANFPVALDDEHCTSGSRAITDRVLRVLMVGSPSLFKGSPRAFEAVMNHRLPIQMKVAGNYPSYIANITKHLPDNIFFEGHVPRSVIKSLFSWADVLLHPSICEGSSLAVSEALLSGLPVITTPNAGVDILNGEDGILIEPHSTPAISNALAQFYLERHHWKNRREAIRDRARWRTIEFYEERLTRQIMDCAMTGITA